MMTKQQIKVFRKQLVEARARFANEIKAIAREAAKNPREASGDLSSYTMHMADMSADTYERELSTGLASSEHEVFYQIEEALKRIEEGVYGDCQQCGKPISLNRLKAVPYSALCIGCQRAKEQKKR